MDNTIIPYQTVSDSSDEELSDSSSNDEHSHLLSNNIGVHFNKFNADIYDLLGRRYDNINCIPSGTIYIRDSKKYIKVKE